MKASPVSPILERLPALERALAAAGFPPLSKFWRTALEAFYRTNRRTLVLRVGRRGGKSSSLCRVAVLEALFGAHRIPPGDVGVVAIISVNRTEAASRLRTIEAILKALNVAYRRAGDVIELEGRPVVFQVFTASISGVSGPTCICVIADEVAKWRDSDTGANPAKEVLASLRPTMATMPSARMFLSSSPLGTEDAHAESFDRGDTDVQAVAWAPTWEANPTISEADCIALEPDERTRRREFGAIPQQGAVDCFDADAIDAVIHDAPPHNPLESPVILMDSSAGRGDAWTWAAGQWCQPHELENKWILDDVFLPDGTLFGRKCSFRIGPDGNLVPNPAYRWGGVPPLFRFTMLEALEGRFAAELRAEDVMDKVAQSARRVGAHHVLADTYQSYFVDSACKARGLTFVPIPWTSESKTAAVGRLRMWFRDQIVSIDPGPQADALRAELLAFQEKILPSGVLSYGARRSKHDDRVALLLNAAIADATGQLRGSPIGRRNRRIDTY